MNIIIIICGLIGLFLFMYLLYVLFWGDLQ